MSDKESLSTVQQLPSSDVNLNNLTSNINIDNSNFVEPNNSQALPTASNDLLDLSFHPNNLSFANANKHSYNIKRPDLSKFKHRFSGRTCVREFLLTFEEYCLARDIHDDHILISFTEVLSDLALKWFRSIRGSITSWKQLKLELLKRFDKLNFDYNLEYNLRTRKQKSSESLSDFIIEIEDMSKRLTYPLAESTLLEIIKHNMLPMYSIHLVGRSIDSLTVLVNLSKQIDDFHVSHSNKYYNFDSKIKNINIVQTLTCLKCKETGHTYKQCNKIPGVICFKCGKPGVTTKLCEICKSNGKIPKNV